MRRPMTAPVTMDIAQLVDFALISAPKNWPPAYARPESTKRTNATVGITEFKSVYIEHKAAVSFWDVPVVVEAANENEDKYAKNITSKKVGLVLIFRRLMLDPGKLSIINL